MKSLAFFDRIVPKWMSRTVLLAAGATALLYGYQHFLPIFRLGYRSELMMLGDFNGNHCWDQTDLEGLKAVQANPYTHSALECFKADLNQDGRLDAEDAALLEQLSAAADPYAAEAKAIGAGRPFPRPRELYHYRSPRDYPHPRRRVPCPARPAHRQTPTFLDSDRAR